MSDHALAGIYTGICSSNRDPEQRLRIRVQVPQLMGAVELGEWAEACLPPGWRDELLRSHINDGGHAQFSGSGTHTHPHVLKQRVPNPGQTVWVMFEGGDIDHPVWMGVGA